MRNVVIHSGESATPFVLSVVGDALPVLLGAAIGFGVSWFFARRAERERQLGLAYELFFEAQRATETISELNRVLTVNLHKVGADHYKYHWQVVQLPTGFDWSTRCHLNAATLALLASAAKFDLINQLMELSRLHDLTLIMTEDYAQRQEALTDKLKSEANAAVSGTTVSMWLTEDTIKRHAPELMRVEDLLQQLLSKVIEGVKFAQPLMERLGPELRSVVGKEFRGRIEYAPKASSPTP